MSELNAAIRDIPIPARMARRPVSAKGFPVPYFVTTKDEAGEWDFRRVESAPIVACIKRKLCWLCGEPLGQYVAFVIGPMCAVNRVSSEPPSHRDCAEYAIKACPFLSRPNMRRNDADLSEGEKNRAIGGFAITHNPGVSLLWITKSYKPFGDGRGGLLIQIGPPLETYWYKERRQATRGEIDAAFDKGLPFLRQMAAMEGREAIQDLDTQIKQAMPLLPVE